MICAHCKTGLSSHYRITHVDGLGATTLDVGVCSIVCLLSWAHAHTVERSTQAAIAAKGVVDRIVSLVKGRK